MWIAGYHAFLLQNRQNKSGPKEVGTGTETVTSDSPAKWSDLLCLNFFLESTFFFFKCLLMNYKTVYL